MTSTQPRISPLPESEWTQEVREILTGLGGDKPLNIFSTLARHPKLLKRWLVFGAHVLRKNTLPARERELLILRIGYLCRSEYEFHQHKRIALACGVSEEEVRRTTLKPEDWSGSDAVLMRAVDELHARQRIGDETWALLSQTWNERQLLDVLFTVGQYMMVAMALNTLGVQVEDGSRGFA